MPWSVRRIGTLAVWAKARSPPSLPRKTWAAPAVTIAFKTVLRVVKPASFSLRGRVGPVPAGVGAPSRGTVDCAWAVALNGEYHNATGRTRLSPVSLAVQ